MREDLDPNQPISAKRVILTSIIVDVLDIVLNLVVAILSGSVIMITQVLEGASDLTSSGLLYIGHKRSMQKEDHTHPFGYGREIYFWTLLSALVMFGITATFSIYLGYERIMHPEPITNLNWALIVLVISIATNGYAFYVSYKRLLHKRRPSQIFRIFYRSSLVETKTTFILDLMGTTASVLGTISLGIYQLTGDQRYDGLGAMIMGVVLAVLAYLLIIGIRDLLVGHSAPAEIEMQIKAAAAEVKDVKHVMGIKTLHIGSEKLLVNLDVNLHSDLTTKEIERLIDDIKVSVRKRVPSVKHIQVEVETLQTQ